jgi:YVTN family beta-propeller protein
LRITLTLLILFVICVGTASAQPYAYIANYDSNYVTIMDISTNQVIANVDVGRRPEGVAVTPGGDFVYVANGGSANVSVIRTSDNIVVNTVQVNNHPAGVAVTPDGEFVYVSNSASNSINFTSSVYRFNKL